MTPEAWDFPRFHGVKAIGFSTAEVQNVLISLIEAVNLNFKEDSISSKPSRSGKYISVTIEVHFNNDQEVKRLYGQLHDHPDIVQSL